MESSLDEKIATVKKLLSEISVIVKNIEKDNTQKLSVKTKKPEKILEVTPELSAFMKLEDNKTTRNSVLKFISSYAKESGLQDMNNKREFLADEVLSNLMKIELNTKITFLSINKYISHLFVKK